jgi:serine/threonine protein kinase
MYKNTNNRNDELSRTSRRDKKSILCKDKDDKEHKHSNKFISIQDNDDDINNNSIRNSIINGGNSVKEVESPKKNKSFINEDNNSDNNELKEFNFNDYKIITQLGQGTFGKIYLVQDKNNQLFSMKKIILSEELDVHTVINEYKMCQKLKHPNVVKILGIYNNKLDRTTYVVYVLMEVGLTDWEKEIRSYNDKNLEYTEKELVQIIKQLSSVLSFLQRNNISHRDIKPQNILVFKNGIYKVADFGEAKQIDNITKNLINNSLRGTELYMSPLLFNGLRTGQIDIKHNLFKSDVYSLGLCTLYAAMTSNKPLYEIRKYVDMAGIKKYLDKLLKGKYSQKFMNLLVSMLEIHEKNRPDFVELEKIMKKWKV